MKPQLSTERNAAMTLFEVGVCIAVVLLLAVIFLPRAAKKYSPSTVCINNLKQVGLAFRIWAGDNNDKYPMGIFVTNGGTMELVEAGMVFPTFLVMSNELWTPKILICPTDASHTVAPLMPTLGKSNVSYFVGEDATNTDNPLLLLSGDINFEIGGKPVKSGLNSFWTNDPVVWSPTTGHMKSGNVCLADGSVTSSSIRNLLQQTGLATNRFAIP